ncbi:MAG: hypothetical protein H0A75_00185 [Candidatus Methanofishera endochildressiae]|uniref:Uncharacterized protein n=1 Tax=Candidatus Methanofishera endochildressiae TaxID=2738884 RepID=A0A7Z0MMF8_9GAMM|nr:hypothetical protein [Candidatus Methanofishera endochildressiae]
MFTKIGEKLVEKAVDNMDDYSHGRTVISHGRLHTVSVRGQTANNDTGDLVKTIRYEITPNSNTMKFGAGNRDIDYAAALEDKNKLNRPNFRKSVEQLKSEIDAIVEASVLDVIQR